LPEIKTLLEKAKSVSDLTRQWVEVTDTFIRVDWPKVDNPLDFKRVLKAYSQVCFGFNVIPRMSVEINDAASEQDHEDELLIRRIIRAALADFNAVDQGCLVMVLAEAVDNFQEKFDLIFELTKKGAFDGRDKERKTPIS
jgi:hypothetical protein